jgi:hypothetical protein
VSVHSNDEPDGLLSPSRVVGVTVNAGVHTVEVVGDLQGTDAVDGT